MRFALLIILAAAILTSALSANGAVTSSAILAKVKAAEANFRDMKAEMVITDANKGNVSKMGKGYGDFLLLEKATVYFKKPDKIRYNGCAKNIKATYVQNGYKKLILAAMVRKLDNVKNAPGKRQDTLDLGFLSSRLWTDNTVSAVSTENGVVKLKLDPKFGGADKRHDFVWIDPSTLKVIKREKYTGSGELRVRSTYSNYQMLGGKLPIATESKIYNGSGSLLGSVSYKNVKSNVGLADSLFSLSQK